MQTGATQLQVLFFPSPGNTHNFEHTVYNVEGKWGLFDYLAQDNLCFTLRRNKISQGKIQKQSVHEK